MKQENKRQSIMREFMKQPFVVALKILLTVYCTDYLLMWGMARLHLEFGANEIVIEPFVMAVIVFPFLYFGILKPFVKSRNRYAQLFVEAQTAEKKAQDRVNQLLSEKNRQLEQAVKKATSELQESEERYQLAAQGARDGLWDYDVSHKKLYLSERWKEILGFTESLFPNDMDAWLSRIHPEDLMLFREKLKAATQPNCALNHECEYRMYHMDGSLRWLLTRWLSVKNHRDKVVRLVGSQTDITDRKEIEQQLLHDSLHDHLTGLPNRVLLYDRLHQGLLRLRRTKAFHFVLLFIDIDNFKRINDSLGHVVGDQLLQEMAKRLSTVMREMDTVSRLGGDEFAIFIEEGFSPKKLDEFLERLFETVQQPITLRQVAVTPQVTIGAIISEERHLAMTPDDLLAEADIALYHAKNHNKGHYVIFNTSLQKNVSQQFEVSNSLKQALKRGEIKMFYQPLIDTDKNRIYGFEALMRWQHPRYGWIAPDSFIPLAEESSLIGELGAYAIQTALSDLVVFNTALQRSDLVMNVNVSGRQIEQTDLFELIQNGLRKNAVLGRQLCIELTESTLMQHTAKVLLLFRNLKTIGAKAAIDDFGVGYSSLSALYQYHFDILKVDQSFLGSKKPDPKALGMIRLIKTMADSLGMQTVVEGVEFHEQLKAVQNIGCHLIQGFYFSKAMNRDDLLALIKMPGFLKGGVKLTPLPRKTPAKKATSGKSRR